MHQISKEELHQVDGGFFPFVIAGIYVSSKAVMITSGIVAAGATYWATH